MEVVLKYENLKEKGIIREEQECMNGEIVWSIWALLLGTECSLFLVKRLGRGEKDNFLTQAGL